MVGRCWHSGTSAGGPLIEWRSWLAMDADDRDLVVEAIDQFYDDIKEAADKK